MHTVTQTLLFNIKSVAQHLSFTWLSPGGNDTYNYKKEQLKLQVEYSLVLILFILINISNCGHPEK
jgi:hypothetical protein